MRRTRTGEETQNARSPFRGGSGNNPSQGIPGPFSQAPPNMDNGSLVERPRSSLIGVHHEPKSLSPFESKKPRHWRAPGLLHSGKLMTSVLTRPRPASKTYHSLTLASVARPQLADLKGAVEADARMARPRRRLIIWENVGDI